MENTTVWLALLPGWLAFLVSIVVLVRSIRNDNRKEIMRAIEKVVDKQDKQSFQISGLESQHDRLGERFVAHEARGREVYSEMKEMITDVRRMFQEFLRKPDHEEDQPATRRDLRHMQTGIDRAIELLANRVGHLEKR